MTLSLDGKPLRYAKVDQPPSAGDDQAVLRVSFLEQVCGLAVRVGEALRKQRGAACLRCVFLRACQLAGAGARVSVVRGLWVTGAACLRPS